MMTRALCSTVSPTCSLALLSCGAASSRLMWRSGTYLITLDSLKAVVTVARYAFVNGQQQERHSIVMPLVQEAEDVRKHSGVLPSWDSITDIYNLLVSWVSCM